MSDGWLRWACPRTPVTARLARTPMTAVVPASNCVTSSGVDSAPAGPDPGSKFVIHPHAFRQPLALPGFLALGLIRLGPGPCSADVMSQSSQSGSAHSTTPLGRQAALVGRQTY